MRSAVVQNGLFRIYEDGTVERLIGRKTAVAAQTPTSRDGRYMVVTAFVDGKQKAYYVHRLVAEAFCPKAKGCTQVNHLDGDSRNNHAENLEWCTPSENVRHAYGTGLVKTETCPVCGREFYNRSGTKGVACRDCVGKATWRIRSEIDSHMEYLQMLIVEETEHMPRRKRIAILRSVGMTLQAIGNIYGISRERVRQICGGDSA